MLTFSTLGPVVQSVVSLIGQFIKGHFINFLADSIYNILIFFAEKNVKATTIFLAKNFSIFAHHSM